MSYPILVLLVKFLVSSCIFAWLAFKKAHSDYNQMVISEIIEPNNLNQNRLIKQYLLISQGSVTIFYLVLLSVYFVMKS